MPSTARNRRVASASYSRGKAEIVPPRLSEVVNSAIPGRVRLRVRKLYRNAKLCHHLEQQLPGRAGIHSAVANALTSNLLVRYETQVPVTVISELVEDCLRNRELPPRTLEMPATNEPAQASKISRLRAMLEKAAHRGARLQATLAGLRPWHEMTKEDVAEVLRSSPSQGMSLSQAETRLQTDGLNVLPRPQPRSAAQIFVRQFASLPVALLAGSALLSIFTGGIADAAVIMAVVLLNAAIGTKTEVQAERTISSLMELGEPRVRVLRDGRTQEIDGSKVVVGDVLLLQRGQYVPADARLIDAQDFTVDESALTGESVPVEKIIEPLQGDGSLPIADRKNMVYRGTIITGGSGKAIVVATGVRTEIGEIHQLVSSADWPETLMERQLGQLGRELVVFTCGVAGLVFLIGLLRGYGLLQMLKISTSLAVAAVPEGLPAVATTTMAYGVWRLRKQNVLVRRLDALETLGAIQVLCFDKTGTLTMNRMSVMGGLVGTTPFSVNAAGTNVPNGDFSNLLRTLVLCNEAALETENGIAVARGSATETALLEFADRLGADFDALRAEFPLIQLQQRTISQNFMATFHRSKQGKKLLAVKGSPVEVLNLCSRIGSDSRERALTEADKKRIATANQKMASEGLRVLAAAEAHGTKDLTLNSGLTWLGLVAIADPPRSGVREAIEQLHRAGIRTAMITGDQRATAQSIANSIALTADGAPEGIDGKELLTSSADRIRGVQVFSRISPGDKLRIVRALQSDGTVVAMTGDGVNDGPALKQADVGIALGTQSTETAREVADIVLLHDSIDTILSAIREGRTIHENITKSVHYISSTNLGEILLVLAGVAAGAGQPLTARQLLWINLLTDVFPCIALAMDPPDEDILERPPNPANQSFLSKSDLARLTTQASIMSATSMGTYLFGAARYGIGPQASTMAFLSLASAQLLHALTLESSSPNIFNAGSKPVNRYIPWALGIGFVSELAAAVVPGIGGLLGAARIGFLDTLLCFLSAGVSFACNETLKHTRNNGAPWRLALSAPQACS